MPALSCPNHPEVTGGLEACGQCGHPFCGDCLVPLASVLTCAGCKLERLKDLRSGAPELDYARVASRFWAACLDALLFLVPSIVFVYTGLAHEFGPHFGPQPPASILARIGIPAERAGWLPVVCSLLLMASSVVYQGWMLAVRGQTLGKMALGIKVVRPNGGDIRAGQAWVRVLSTLALAEIFLGPIDDLLIFSRRHRTLHDRLAGTVVVNVRR